jgi:hypothetical protein
MAALRLGGSDGKLFMDIFDRLLELSPSASGEERRACFRLARRMWELHYESGEERDLDFLLGMWMRELGYLFIYDSDTEDSKDLTQGTAEMTLPVPSLCRLAGPEYQARREV